MIGEFIFISGEIRKEIALVFDNPNDKILDLGCGRNPGYHKSIKGKIACFDIAKSEIADVVGDADRLDKYFKEESFDKVVCINSFYYFKNPFNVVRHINKILKKDGLFVLVVPFFYPIHDVPDDKYRFTEFGLRAVLEENFKIEKIKAIGGIFNLPAIVLHSVVKGIPLYFPKKTRKIIKIIISIIYPFYFIAQLFSLLDVFDRTKRFPTYYFVVARRK